MGLHIPALAPDIILQLTASGFEGVANGYINIAVWHAGFDVLVPFLRFLMLEDAVKARLVFNNQLLPWHTSSTVM
jgi:hypothetical protein